jgi:hypothetical protein
MSVIRLIAIAVLFAIAIAVPSQGQQPHWLVGTWKGELGNVVVTSRMGSERTLVVKRVAPDGSSARATWTGLGEGLTVNLTIAGDEVSFVTPGSLGNSYKLTHKGDMLEGSWQRSGSGKGGPASLKKQ